MDVIMKLLDMDLAKFVPDLTNLLDHVRTLVTVSVLVGPLILLVLGLIYLFIPPNEANHRFGFRTYFGMGSVEAWRFTQKIAGLAFGAIGAILLIAMLIVVAGFGGKDHFEMVNTTVKSLIWQAGLALFARIFVSVLVTALYDRNGNLRKDKRRVRPAKEK